MYFFFPLQRDTVRAASEFVTRNHLPHDTQDQILSHLSLKFKTDGLKQQETIKGMPKAIRAAISHQLFYPVVQKSYLFQQVSHDFLFQLVTTSHSLLLAIFKTIDYPYYM